MVRTCLLFVSAVLFTIPDTSAQESLKYQLPPVEIVKIVDAPQAPSISVSPDKSKIVLIERPNIITIKELSAGELRLAGLRIDPAINGPSRQTYNKGYKIMNIDGTDIRDIAGMPDNPSLGYPLWSADSKKFLFTNRKPATIELWICDVLTLKTSKIAEGINMVFGNPANWLSDNISILYYVTDPGRGSRPVRSNVPSIFIIL